MLRFQGLLSTELKASYSQGLIHRKAVQWPEKRRGKMADARISVRRGENEGDV
ncbi:MAG: hypothetical protein JWQ16_3531 [Novosphingobium sp.]|nr:hypothetical protein [Novosphingobium sp.]